MTAKGDSLGDRIKRYEATYAHTLTPRSCLVIRVDGKAFHTFTKGCEKPFDQPLIEAMVDATKFTASQMQGFKLAYTQSDEATFLLTDYDTYDTQGWFGYELNKVVSISASAFTAAFNQSYTLKPRRTVAMFDSRAFIVPQDDAANVFLWRQQDWERNSLQMLARAHFSHKELHGKNHAAIHEMLHSVGVNWADLSNQLKNGTYVDRNLIEIYDQMCYTDLHNQLFNYYGDDS
jgi:tRNA(His) guanylyltransferase